MVNWFKIVIPGFASTKFGCLLIRIDCSYAAVLTPVGLFPVGLAVCEREEHLLAGAGTGGGSELSESRLTAEVGRARLLSCRPLHT